MPFSVTAISVITASTSCFSEKSFYFKSPVINSRLSGPHYNGRKCL